MYLALRFIIEGQNAVNGPGRRNTASSTLLSSPMRRRAGATNIICMQLMHASHEMKRKAYHEICNVMMVRFVVHSY